MSATVIPFASAAQQAAGGDLALAPLWSLPTGIGRQRALTRAPLRGPRAIRRVSRRRQDALRLAFGGAFLSRTATQPASPSSAGSRRRSTVDRRSLRIARRLFEVFLMRQTNDLTFSRFFSMSECASTISSIPNTRPISVGGDEPFELYRWNGRSGEDPTKVDGSAAALAALKDFTPEAMVVAPEGAKVLVLSDDGDRCSDPPSFRGAILNVE